MSSAAVIDFPHPDHQETPDTTTTPEAAVTEAALTTAPAVGVLIELDPDAVAQHPDNVRDSGRDLKALTASIAEVGVLVPLIVVPVESVPRAHEWSPGATHVAIDGNRRQAAARAAGLPLPCVVRPDLASARDALRTMAVTGLVRDGLTVTEEARAVAALFEAGMSQTAIGRALGRSREQVKTAKKAAALTFDAAAADYPLTLDQMAVLADWEQTPGAVDRLIEAMSRGRLDHVVATLHREAEEAAIVSAAVLELGEAVTIAQEEPRRWGNGPRTLDHLRPSPASPTGEAIDPEAHRACPGHAVWIEATDDPTPEEEEDPARWDEDGEWIPGGRLRAEYTPLCLDPDRYGHAGLWDRRSTGGPAYVDTEPQDGETDDETAARIDAARSVAVAAQVAAEEERRLERRALIANNKQADTAQGVRREFLRQCLTVKSRHKAMLGWALCRIVARDRAFTSWCADPRRSPVMREVLGDELAEAPGTVPEARHGVMVWAYLVIAHEEAMPRDAHRNPNIGQANYLRHLAALGYVLADVEAMITAAFPDPTDPAPTASATDAETGAATDDAA